MNGKFMYLVSLFGLVALLGACGPATQDTTTPEASPTPTGTVTPTPTVSPSPTTSP